MKTSELLKRGNWMDGPCYYADVRKDSATIMLAGPFRTKAEADAMLEPAREIARKKYEQTDPHWPWYAFGTCKAPNGHREGVLNAELGL